MLTAQKPIPLENAERYSLTSSVVAQQQSTLSQKIVPAVPGEYYSYSSLFTRSRPLYALLKCKANKARSTKDIDELGPEASAFFEITGESSTVYTTEMATVLGLLRKKTFTAPYGKTLFASTGLSAEAFQMLRASRNVDYLMEECQRVSTHLKTAACLRHNQVFAITTDSGKFGMFLVRELTAVSLQIDACHVLI